MTFDAFQPLLSVSYWFEYYPSAFHGFTYWLVLGGSGAAVFIGILLAAGARLVKDAGWHRVLTRLGKLWLTVGFLNLISFFFTQTYTPLLGSRFWFVLWVVVTFTWLYFIVRYAVLVAPIERAERAKQQEYLKYLPKNR